MLAPLLRFVGNRAGNVATLFALLSPVLIGVAALAVDEASLYLERRKLQIAADLAAIYAAGDPSNAAARARLALSDQGFALPPEAIVVVTGRYVADPTRPPADRFVPGATPPNAARVAVATVGRLHFASIFGIDPPSLGATATASATPAAAYSIGSRLASFNGGVVNAVLGGLLGTELSLSLLDYDALVDLDVDLLSFLDALAGEIGLTVGTYSDLLDADVALADIALALASAADGNALLLRLAGSVDPAVDLDMARLIAAQGIAHLALGTAAAIEAQVNALQMLTAAATVADGERQISLDLGVDIPNLTAMRVRLVVGEPPQGGWFTFAGEGSYVRTAQVRLKIDVGLGRRSRGSLIGVGLPVYAEIAPAEARLTRLVCPPGRPDRARATIAARPGLLKLAIGKMSEADFLDTTRPLAITEPAPIVSLLGGLASVTALAQPRIDQTAPVTVHVDHADAVSGRIQTVKTSTPISSLVASLFGSLELELDVLRLSLIDLLVNEILLGGVLDIVESLLAPLSHVLDDVLVVLLDGLGLGLGEADIRVHGFDCRNATLVQ